MLLEKGMRVVDKTTLAGVDFDAQFSNGLLEGSPMHEVFRSRFAGGCHGACNRVAFYERSLQESIALQA